MKPVILPYGIRFQEDGHIETFPAAEINILGRGSKGIRAILHIDSGASTSLLPKSDAEVLGLDLSDGQRVIVRGVGEVILTGYRHIVRFNFDGRTFTAPVIISDQNNVPRVLGREEIFKRFGIVFDEARKRTAFLDERSQRKIIDALFR